jgi:DNA polymerase III delta prime subunit
MYSWLQHSYIQACLLLQYSNQGLLLHGNQGVGKKILALQLAKNLICNTPELKSINYTNLQQLNIHTELSTYCNTCQSCHLFDIQEHPDFYLLDSLDARTNDLNDVSANSIKEAKDNKDNKTNKNSIGIDAIQNIIQRVQSTANVSKRIVVVINGIEDMTIAASNALLKTLEEPNTNVHFILISNHIRQILPTILSRCMQLHVQKPNQQQAYVYFSEQHESLHKDIHALYKYQPLHIDSHDSYIQDMYEQLTNFLLKPHQIDLNIDIKKTQNMQFFLATVYYWLFDLANYALYKNKPMYFSSIASISASKKFKVQAIFDCWKQINEFSQHQNFAINPKLILAMFVYKYQEIWNK